MKNRTLIVVAVAASVLLMLLLVVFNGSIESPSATTPASNATEPDAAAHIGSAPIIPQINPSLAGAYLGNNGSAFQWSFPGAVGGGFLPDGGAGAMWYQNADGAVTALPIGTTGQVIVASDAGIPRYANSPGARLIPIDSNTQLYWTFDETSTNTFPNHGNGGTLNMVWGSGASFTTRSGVFSYAYSSNSTSAADFGSANTDAGFAEPTSITVSWWGYLRAYTSFADWVVKQYAPNTAPPPPSIQVQLDNSGNGGMQWLVQVLPGGDAGTGATVNFNSLATYDKPQLFTWYFYAMTYSPSTGLLSAYINGNLVGTANAIYLNSPIDWNTHGAWALLGNNTGTENMFAMIDDVRIESTVRSQSYLQTMYFSEIGWGQ